MKLEHFPGKNLQNDFFIFQFIIIFISLVSQAVSDLFVAKKQTTNNSVLCTLLKADFTVV